MTTLDDVMFLVNRSQEANALGTKILTRQVRAAILTFAAERVAAEREACADLAGEFGAQVEGIAAYRHLAAAIRARGNP